MSTLKEPAGAQNVSGLNVSVGSMMSTLDIATNKLYCSPSRFMATCLYVVVVPGHRDDRELWCFKFFVDAVLHQQLLTFESNIIGDKKAEYPADVSDLTAET